MAVLLVLGAAAPAPAHGPVPHGVSAAKAQAFESRVIGPEHAAVHASRFAVAAKRAAARRKTRRLASRCRKYKAGKIRDASSRSLSKKCKRLAAWRRAKARAQARERVRARARALALGPASDVGQWDASAFSIPVMAIHAALLPTGKVMWFAYPQNPSRVPSGGSAPNTSQAWLWDPATGQTKRVDPPLINHGDGQLRPANIWCAGQTFTKDGRLVVFGGNLAYSNGAVDFKGLNKVFTFNPFTETWTQQPDMRHGRWYPTGVRLPDGRIPIVQGLDETGSDPGNTGQNENEEIEIFTPSADMNGVGSIQLLGSTGAAGAPPQGDYYPHMFVMPSGRTIVAGPDPKDSWLLDFSAGSLSAWIDIPNLPADRVWGTGVLLPNSSRAMLIGGSPGSSGTSLSVNTSLVYDEANPGAGWQPGASLNVGRGHANTKLLPDGSMVEIGGGVGVRGGDQWAADPEQKQVELWDPATNAWRLGPPEAENRAYHSTSLLLPDGSVVSAGDDSNGGTNTDSAQIYRPPYLFRGARPTITSAPACVRLGQVFDVGATGGVSRVTMVAPGATTHANDMNQRFVELAAAPTAGGASVTAPASATVGIPGYYMMFVLNAQGVPSVAKFVRVLGPSDPDCPLPAPAPVTGSSGDTKAPSVTVRRVSSSKLSTALKRGIKVGVRCSERCTVRLKLLLGGRQAKQVGLSRRARPVRIAPVKKVSFTKAGTKQVTIKISRKARTRLSRSKLTRIKLTLVSTATDRAGNTRTRKLAITLKR